VRGFAALCMDEGAMKQFVRDRVDKEALKKAKKDVRDIIVLCCVSICGGLDSKEAFVRALEEVLEQVDHFPGYEHFVSQCTNAFRRVCEDVAHAQLLEAACTSGSSGCGLCDQGAGGSQAGAVDGASMGSSGVGACSHEHGLQDEGGGGGGGSQLEVAPASVGGGVKCSGLGSMAGDGPSLSPVRMRSRSPRGRGSSQLSEVMGMLRVIKRDLDGLKPGNHRRCGPYTSGRRLPNNPHFLHSGGKYFDLRACQEQVSSDCGDDSDSDDFDGCDHRAD